MTTYSPHSFAGCCQSNLHLHSQVGSDILVNEVSGLVNLGQTLANPGQRFSCHTCDNSWLMG